MINPKLTAEDIESAYKSIDSATLFNLTGGISLLGELQKKLGINDDATRSDDLRLTAFDEFEYAWNALLKKQRLLFLTQAYYADKPLFKDIKMNDRLSWSDFSFEQQEVIRAKFQETILAAFEVVFLSIASRDLVDSFIEGRKEREMKAFQELDAENYLAKGAA